MKYSDFIEAIDEVVMGIGDVADRLNISIEEVKSWEKLTSVPQEALDLLEFERDNIIHEDDDEQKIY